MELINAFDKNEIYSLYTSWIKSYLGDNYIVVVAYTTRLFKIVQFGFMNYYLSQNVPKGIDLVLAAKMDISS